MRRIIPRAQGRRFLPAQEGATAIEYAMIASGIAGAIAVTLTTLGSKEISTGEKAGGPRQS